MSVESSQSVKWGILSGASAYLLWGTLPIYWKWLEHIPPEEVLAHRIIWSFILLLAVLFLLGKSPSFIKECQSIIQQPKAMLGIFLAAIFITANWFTYIWAVTNNHILEASLGYYINPLVSVLMGVFFLKEQLSKMQWLSVGLAGTAVLLLTVSFGSFPSVAIVLAFSFAIYGLLKKIVRVGALTGLAIETLIVAPFAIGYLIIQHSMSLSMFYFSDQRTFWLLIGAGAATATPLLLFGAGAKRIPLSLMGFLQYIAPTIMLFLGIFLYRETFSSIHFVAFTIIWVALLLFTISRYQISKKLKRQALEIASKNTAIKAEV
ncbi:EamA family transporter RarD [Evansella tamaricis]|uniref:EamA family transporter RarD n=1 Tax=Evansella tamaricis TaxID=2069301 RepID=A0ABS6JCW7_9BACI|nr:EamA family transporter RarD [Evansella tamaricis]MBU9711509.1 EamA family transporter RarD [Evansella tamaricis]